MPIEFDFSDFEAKAKALASRVKAKEKKAVAAGAEVIRAEIEARAPVDTGNLKNNIIATEPKEGADGSVVSHVGPKYGGKGDPYYAKFVEFGTVKMRARPFIEPAFLAKKKDAIQTMTEVMKEAVD
jgi:HK97 gp10 family phage protein